MPPITVALLLGPVILGLGGIILLSLGVIGPASGPGSALAPLLAMPGLVEASFLTVKISLIATGISLLAALSLLALLPGAWVRPVAGLAAPLVALPPATVAIGLGFLLTGSGWLSRIISPSLTGWERPPSFGLDGEISGLILALVVKETPFLLLAALVALPRLDTQRRLALAATLGYGPVMAWAKTVIPGLMHPLRLPIWAAIAFSAGQVDMAVLIGPDLPPPLAVLIWQTATAPDPMAPAVAAQGALLLLFIAAGTIALWEAFLWAGKWLLQDWVIAGGRGISGGAFRRIAEGAVLLIAATPILLGGMAAVGLALWSITGVWRFPAALPTSFSGAPWGRAVMDLSGTLLLTLALAAVVAGVAALLSLGCLEAEDRRAQRPGAGHLWVLYTPLLVPQVSFLFGATAGLAAVGGDGTLMAVGWFHLTFVLPYVWLVLAGPWRALDPRWGAVVASLGHGADAALWRVKVPLLSPAIILGLGLGMVVSISLYLPTQFAGAGRISTLATETVGIALGADRRTSAVYALALGLPAIGCLILAVVGPLLFWRHRRGLGAT